MDDVKKCPKCGKPIIDQFVYCPFCGEEIVPKCKKCGEPLAGGANFCAKCGTKANEEIHVDVEDNNKHVHAKCERKHISKGGVIAIVKSAFVVLVCTLMFAFSFAGIIGIDAESLLNDVADTDEVRIDGGNINLNAVDFIKLMFASARKYDDVKDARKLAKLEEKCTESLDEMLECIDDDMRGSKLVLSTKTKFATNAFIVDCLEYAISRNTTSTTPISSTLIYINGSSICTICVVGAVSFINIFVTATLLAFAIAVLVKTIKSAIGIGNKDVRILTTVDVLLPFLIVLPLVSIFALSPLTTYIVLASELVTGLVFASLAVLFVFALALIRDVKKHGSINVIIPKIITLVLCVVMLGCCFAPMFNATFEVQLNGEEKEKEYSTNLYAHVFSSGLLTEAQMEVYEEDLKETRKWTLFTNYIDKYVEIVKSSSEKILYMGDEAIIKNYAESVTTLCCFAQLGIHDSAILSVGYFVLMVVILLCGGCIGAMISGNQKSQIATVSLALIFAIAMVGLSIALCHIVDYQMDTMDSYAFKLEIGGGGIAVLAMSAIAIVFSATSPKVWAPESGDDEEYSDVTVGQNA